MVAASANPMTYVDYTDSHKNHLLIVDDDDDNLTLLTHILNRHYELTTAKNGEDALQLLETESYDAVLLDIMMPGMSGLEVLEIIRRNTGLATLPVIMISALSDSKHVVQGLKLGANDYVSKPIDVNVMMARLRTHIKLKHLSDEREETINQLRNAQDIRDRIFRVASHDLKNPLANIRMAEYVLRDSVSNDPVATQMMDTVTLSLDTMQDVIEDFMDVVVLQSGRIDIDLKKVDVGSVMYDGAMAHNAHAMNKGITLDIHDTKLQAIADNARLKQVFSNLLSNAIKYSPHNTTVTIWAKQVDGCVRIHVADQGPGIPPDERPLLFTEFGKLTPRPTGQESSTGLGLWIAKSMAELMRGNVGVDFPAEGGAVFWVQVPVHQG